MTLTIKVLSGILSFLMFFSPAFGIKNENENAPREIKTVTVALDGSGDFKTIEEARDYVRSLDKSKYSGIDVVVNARRYHLDSALTLTEEDSGTETCPITYKGEEGTVIEGLVHLTSDDFSPATGAYTKYFRDDVKNNIVELDLKKYGYTKDDIKALYYISEGRHKGEMTINIRENIPILCADDAFLTIARYPNTEVALSRPGSTAAHNGEPINAESAIDLEDEYIVYTDEEHIERVRSWHSLEKVYTDMYLSYLWCEESSRMLRVSDTEPYFVTSFSGGHNPQKQGMPIYWYNIPEELDCPGEYIIDDDAVLYIYKPENYDDVSYTIVRTDRLLDVQGADYVTFDGFIFEGCSTLAVNVRADNFTFSDNIIRIIQRKGAEIYGSGNKITGNEFYNIGFDVLDFGGGDAATLTRSNNLCDNNYIHDYGVLYPDESNGISVNGIGDTVSHNEVTGGPQCAIGCCGNLNVMEYNYIHDTMTKADDLGAFSSADEFKHYGNVYRYNYLENIGPTDKAYRSGEIPDYWPACGCMGFYFDFHGSGNTVYGNVINGVYGSGMFTLGKMNKYTNNLVVGAAKYSFEIGLRGGYQQFRDDQSQLGPQERPSYITEAWLKEFSELKKIKWNTYDSIDDPDYWATPSGTVVRDNVTILDKGNWSKGLANGKMKGYDIDKYVLQFSEIEESELQIVSSKREPYNIEDLVRENEETLGMTLEEFGTIGRRK